MTTLSFVMAAAIAAMVIMMSSGAAAFGGVGPQSALLYGIDLTFDELSVSINPEAEARIERGLDIADERLGEIAEMAAKRQVELAVSAQARYEFRMNQVIEDMEKIDLGGDEKDSLKTLERLSRIENKIERGHDKLLETQDTQVQQSNLSIEQRERLEQVFNSIITKAEQAIDKLHSKKERLQSKHKALSGKNSTDLSSEIERIENGIGLVQGRKERARNEMERARRLREELSRSQDYEVLRASMQEIDSALNEAQRLCDQGMHDEARYLSSKAREYGSEVRSIARTLEQAKKEGTLNETLEILKLAIAQRHLEFDRNTAGRLRRLKQSTLSESQASEGGSPARNESGGRPAKAQGNITIANEGAGGSKASGGDGQGRIVVRSTASNIITQASAGPSAGSGSGDGVTARVVESAKSTGSSGTASASGSGGGSSTSSKSSKRTAGN